MDFMIDKSRTLLRIACCCLLFGCSSVSGPEDHISLLFDRSAYVFGDTASVQLVNNSDEGLSYGACTFGLERQSGSGWTRATPTFPCIGVGLSLRPGEVARHREALPATLGAGTYRFSADVQLDRGRNLHLVSESLRLSP
jgi:hypothetical protein